MVRQMATLLSRCGFRSGSWFRVADGSGFQVFLDADHRFRGQAFRVVLGTVAGEGFPPAELGQEYPGVVPELTFDGQAHLDRPGIRAGS
jgi:hypothetical protein